MKIKELRLERGLTKVQLAKENKPLDNKKEN